VLVGNSQAIDAVVRTAAIWERLESTADGVQGQSEGASTVVWPGVAARLRCMEQWCAPARRQQAGRRDSSTLPVHPEATPDCRLAANMDAEPPAGPNPRTSRIKMGRMRRIAVLSYNSGLIPVQARL
jgi:hypothetical protein